MVVVVVVVVVVIVVAAVLNPLAGASGQQVVAVGAVVHVLRDRDLYTTTNECLQCPLKVMYSVF